MTIQEMVKLAEGLNEKSIVTVHRMLALPIPEEVRENVEDVLISLQGMEDRLLDLNRMLRARQKSNKTRRTQNDYENTISELERADGPGDC